MVDVPPALIFRNEAKARAWLEARIWKDGVICPHCASANASDEGRVTKLTGKAHRAGLYQCNHHACRRQFTVTVGTVLERSKIPLSKWLAALYLMSAPGKPISVQRAHRLIGVSYKSTWYMVQRLREAVGEEEQNRPALNAGISVEQPRLVRSATQKRTVAAAPEQSQRERMSPREVADRANQILARLYRLHPSRSTASDAALTPEQREDLRHWLGQGKTPAEIERWEGMGITELEDEVDEWIRWRRPRR